VYNLGDEQGGNGAKIIGPRHVHRMTTHPGARQRIHIQHFLTPAFRPPRAGGIA
jgi:hypothetical protein